MIDYLKVVFVLVAGMVFVSLFLLPTRLIGRSGEVRGLKKSAWSGLCFLGMVAGVIAVVVIFRSLPPAYRTENIQLLLAIAVGPVPTWFVYFLFKRTRPRQ